MKRSTVLRLVRLSALLCASTCIPGFALAQTAPVPAVRSVIDQNGVDLVSGKWLAPTASVSIGGAQGLTYERGTREYRSNLGGGVKSSGTTYTVAVGASSEIFTLSGGVYTPAEARGSSLTYNATSQEYTYRNASGATAVFSKSMGIGGNYNQGVITSLTAPSGVKQTYGYVSVPATYGSTVMVPMLVSVANNFGYQIQFTLLIDADHQTVDDGIFATKVTAFNSAVETCAPTNYNCALSSAWPSLTFSSGEGPTDWISITTDQAGRALQILTPKGSSTGFTTTKTYRRPDSADVVYTTTLNGATLYSVTSGTASWTYTYGSSGSNLTTTITDALGHQRIVVSDPVKMLVLSDTDALGHTVSYAYDANNRLHQVTQPEGNYALYDYDARGNLTTVTQVAKPGSGLANIVTTAGYDATCSNAVKCNKPNWTKDALGNQTDYTYDATHGGLLAVTSPAPTAGAVRPETRIAYRPLYAWYKNSAGVLSQAPTPVYLPTSTSSCVTTASCAGAADEVKTTIAYGAAGVANNLMSTSVTAGAGDGSLSATTTLTYTNFGEVETVDGPLAGAADTTRYRYNAARQLVGVIGPDPDGVGAMKNRAVRLGYDGTNRPTMREVGTVNSQSDADWASFASLQRVETAYDASGRKISDVVVAGGSTQTATQYGYDAAGRQICQATRMNPAAFATAPGACSLGTEGADGPDRITYNTYDNADRLLKVTSGYGTSSPRDEAVITYSTNGLTQTAADGKGNLTTYEYDGFDRPSKVRYPNASGGGSSTTDFESYAYDGASNVIQANRRGAVTNYAYDALGRLTYKDNTPGWYYYDNLNRPTVTYAGSGAEKANLQYYDGLGRPSWTYDWTGSAWRVASYATYDLAGQLTQLQWQDGFYVNYDYDAAGEITGVRENGGTQLASYSYDDLGRRTGTYRGNGAQSLYNYDLAGRLGTLTLNPTGTAQDQVYSFAYNAAGQIKSRISNNDAYRWTGGGAVNRSYTINGLNQVTAIGAVGTAHDAKGNLTNDGASTYSYDTDNHLTGASTGAVLTYDPLGRLGRVVGATTTQFVYAGSNLIAELDAAGNVLRRYVPGPGIDEPLLWYEGAGTTDRRYLLPDERGSIVAVTDGVGVATVNTYDEYGVPGAGNQGRFQYTGQTFVSELGVYNYKARMYSPTLGRFMQTDPIGYGDGMNWYAYVGNDPVNSTDPMGLADTVGPLTVTGCPKNSVCSREDIERVLDQLAKSYQEKTGNLVDAVVVVAVRKGKSIQFNFIPLAPDVCAKDSSPMSDALSNASNTAGGIATGSGLSKLLGHAKASGSSVFMGKMSTAAMLAGELAQMTNDVQGGEKFSVAAAGSVTRMAVTALYSAQGAAHGSLIGGIGAGVTAGPEAIPFGMRIGSQLGGFAGGLLGSNQANKWGEYVKYVVRGGC